MNNGNLETMSCCACGSTINPVLILRNTKDGWHIVRCPLCDLTFVYPQPPKEKISAFYNGMYSEFAVDYNEQKMLWAMKSVNNYSNIIDKYKNKNLNTLLDIGGGLGYYAKAFEDVGFDVTIVEQDTVSAKFAKDVLEINNVIENNVDKFLQDNSLKYDVVFMRHVIEHSTNPNTLIKKVYECLSDSGILIIETDNNSGVEWLFRPGTAKFYRNIYRSSFLPSSYFSLLKMRVFAVDPPRHLYGFRISNLTKMLQRNSLIPRYTKCYRLGHPVYWPNLPLPTVRDVFETILQFKIKQLVANIIDILLFPIRILLEKFGLASGICIYAIKKKSD
jgi:SAM-dependent methyltransferase